MIIGFFTGDRVLSPVIRVPGVFDLRLKQKRGYFEAVKSARDARESQPRNSRMFAEAVEVKNTGLRMAATT